MFDKELYNLNDLKTFYITASCSSFSKAAEKIGVTQAAVSQTIKSIEEQLGVELFKRNNNGIKLTQAGLKYLYYIEKAFNLVSSGNKIIEEYKEVEVTEINIGVPAHIGAFYFMDYLAIFNKNHPNVKIRILDKSSIEMKKMLETKELDLLIDTDLVETNDKNIVVKKIKDLTGVFVGNKSFVELSRQKNVSVKKISEYPLILPNTSTSTRKLIDSSFGRQNIALHPNIETNSTFIALNLIESGLGIGWLLYDVVHKDISEGKFVKINVDVDDIKIPLSMAYQPQNINKLLQEVIDLLKNS